MRVGEKNIQKKRSLGQTEATKCSGNHPAGKRVTQIPAGKYGLAQTTILYISD